MNDKYVLYIDGYKLVLTCFACPQQFDVFDIAGTQVAYFRIRHGRFVAHCPDFGGDIVYNCAIKGDGILLKDEQLSQLKAAINEVQIWIIDQMYKNIAFEE